MNIKLLVVSESLRLIARIYNEEGRDEKRTIRRLQSLNGGSISTYKKMVSYAKSLGYLGNSLGAEGTTKGRV